MSTPLKLTDAGRGLLIRALSGEHINFTRMKIGSGGVPKAPSAGDYWYNEAEEKLYRFLNNWENDSRNFVLSEEAPQNPSTGDLWYDQSKNKLMVYANSWKIAANFCVGNTPRTNAAVGDFWANTSARTLHVHRHIWSTNSTDTFTAASSEPQSPSLGDYWYDTTNSKLMKYVKSWVQDDVTGDIFTNGFPSQSTGHGATPRVIHNPAYAYYEGSLYQYISGSCDDPESWALVTYRALYPHGSAPSNPNIDDWTYDENGDLLVYAYTWAEDETHTLVYGGSPVANESTIGTWWYDTDSNELKICESVWPVYTESQVTFDSVSPIQSSDGDYWFNTINNYLYVFVSSWENSRESIAFENPTTPSAGDLWYDTTGDSPKLMVYKHAWAINETTFSRALTAPENPGIGDLWYDISKNTLYEYNGVDWADVISYAYSESIWQPDELDSLTDLINPEISIEIYSFARNGWILTITGNFDNSAVTNGFCWTETGVFATGEDGNEVLYAYAHSGDDYDTIPANNVGRTMAVSLTVVVAIDDAKTITVNIGEGSIYVTQEQLELHLTDYNNPHKVTKKDLGLDRVENVSPDDMEITFSAAESLEEPESGEPLSVLFGKLKLALRSLILHLRANNPHKITLSKLGGAEKDHKHSAKDITTDILPIEHGGTGLNKGADFEYTRKWQTGTNNESRCTGAIELPGGLLVQWGWIKVDAHSFECIFKRSYADTDYALVFPSCADAFVPVWKNPAKRTDGFTMTRTFGINSIAANITASAIARPLAKIAAAVKNASSIDSPSDAINWLKSIGSFSNNDNEVKTFFGVYQLADWISVGKAAK